MCRFVAYLGEPIPLDLLLLKPVNSLVHQSLDAKEFRLRVNGDGFGVAWYVAGRDDPVRLRTVTPAWSNQNVRSLAPVMESSCILAHIRAASPGMPVVETNCHPFTHGRFAFCHNGTVGRFRRVRRALQNSVSEEAFDVVQGTTDSELLFAVFLDEMREREGEEPAQAMGEALAATVRRAVRASPEAACFLNLCVTDGRRIAGTRFSNAKDGSISSLYYHAGRRYVCEEGQCRMIEPGDHGVTAIVASERLSEDAGWEPVPVNHVGVIDADRTASAWPLEL